MEFAKVEEEIESKRKQEKISQQNSIIWAEKIMTQILKVTNLQCNHIIMIT